jgi:chemotaxis protein methyltransferase CheR
MAWEEMAAQQSLLLAKPIPDLSDDEFQLFRGLVLRESGIHLGAKNRAMLVSRLWKRLRALELKSFSAYFRKVKADPREMVLMLDCICTNETHFFREPAAFECLRARVFPEWIADADAGKRSRTIRVWSAACSTGEEVYSLAMLLLTQFPPAAGWNVEVLGTDLSTKVLAHASAGIWPVEKTAGVPPEYQRRFFLKGFGPERGKMKVTDELRGVVRFDRLNLTRPPYATNGPFDLIFCRNVLIYFQWETKIKVVDSLGKHLARRGYLFLGHAESLHGVTDKLRFVAPKVFPSQKGAMTRGALCILQGRDQNVRD